MNWFFFCFDRRKQFRMRNFDHINVVTQGSSENFIYDFSNLLTPFNWNGKTLLFFFSLCHLRRSWNLDNSRHSVATFGQCIWRCWVHNFIRMILSKLFTNKNVTSEQLYYLKRTNSSVQSMHKMRHIIRATLLCVFYGRKKAHSFFEWFFSALSLFVCVTKKGVYLHFKAFVNMQ